MKRPELIARIKLLKEKRSAVILAHNYQLPEIQDIADFVGDSLELARQAKNSSARVIVLCGVYFMAETAKILNPQKTVLIPDELSGCPLADSINTAELAEMLKEHPGAPAVAYVNTSAAVKALSSVCCTSANAVKVVNARPEKEIIFIPDCNLGYYVSRHTTKKIILPKGFCVTHVKISAAEIITLKKRYPQAVFLAHPECPPEIQELAEVIASTSQMLQYVRRSPAKEFIIATEMGLLHRLEQENPDKKFYLASPSLICPNMKKNNLEKLFASLRDLTYEVKIPEDIRIKAARTIEKMFELTEK
jgi:quinolinate synthase